MAGQKKDGKDTIEKILREQSLLITLGFILILNGIFFFLANTGAFGLSLRVHWPVAVIITGLAFMISDLLLYRKIRTSFLFSALLFSFLGVIFLLFSTHTFRVSFRRFFSLAWPVFLVLVGAVLLVIYWFQKKKKNDFPYMDEDPVENNL